MAETQSTQDPERSPEEEAAGVLLLLLTGAGLAATAGAIAAFLGLPLSPVLMVMSMMRVKTPKQKAATRHGLTAPSVAVPGKKTAVQIASDANNHYRAAFLVNSSRRVAEAPDPKSQLAREQQFWNAHVAASNRRLYAAHGVDEAASKNGKLLGWYATIDARTTDDCRAANGRNFYATKPPVIGFPGGVHLFCRCIAGPPHPEAKMVDQSSTVRFSKDASGFEKREGDE